MRQATRASVHETATELLNGQNALFPEVVKSSHPLKSILANLTTCEHREEMQNINTIGDLSRLDEASVYRPAANSPKTSQARAVLTEYKMLTKEQTESDDTEF